MTSSLSGADDDDGFELVLPPPVIVARLACISHEELAALRAASAESARMREALENIRRAMPWMIVGGASVDWEQIRNDLDALLAPTPPSEKTEPQSTVQDDLDDDLANHYFGIGTLGEVWASRIDKEFPAADVEESVNTLCAAIAAAAPRFVKPVRLPALRPATIEMPLIESRWNVAFNEGLIACVVTLRAAGIPVEER